MGLLRTLGIGIFCLGLGCGIGGSTSDYDTGMEDAASAMDYVAQELVKPARGYNVERKVIRLLQNPNTSEFIVHEYDVHALHPVNGDEQFWEAEMITPDLRALRDAFVPPPDIMLVEPGEYEPSTLNAFMDYACNN